MEKYISKFEEDVYDDDWNLRRKLYKDSRIISKKVKIKYIDIFIKGRSKALMGGRRNAAKHNIQSISAFLADPDENEITIYRY